MAIKLTQQKIFNEEQGEWDTLHLETTASQVIQETDKLFMKSGERTKVADYLTEFNTANKLVQADATGHVAAEMVPALGLKLNAYNPTFTGILTGPTVKTGTVKAENDDLYLNGQGAIRLSVDAADGFIDAGALLIKNVKTPVSDGDAATKDYVDTLVSSGLHTVAYVKLATNVEVDVFSRPNDIDGTIIRDGDRVLLLGQTSQEESSNNGIYVVADHADTDTHTLEKVEADNALGAYVFVDGGNVYNDWYFTNTGYGIWSATSRPDTIKPGTGISKIGNTLSLKDTATKLNVENPTFTGDLRGSRIVNDTDDINKMTTISLTADRKILISTDYFECTGSINTDSGINADGGGNFGFSQLKDLGAPTDDNDATNKEYVDKKVTSGTLDPSIIGRVAGDIYFQFR